MPEDTLIKKMLGTSAAIQEYGCDPSIAASGMAQISLLAAHLMTKAQMAYNQYSSDNKKYFAVVKAMLTASATLQLLGGSSRADLLAELGSWAKNYYDAQANKLIKDHDYSVINSLMLLAGQASLFGVNNIYLGQMEEALTFKFSLNEDLKNVVDGTLSDHIVIKGDTSFNLFSPAATAKINYVSGYLIDGCQDSQGNPQPAHDEIVLPQSFPLTVKLTRFDLCESDIAVIKFSMLGAQTEDWNFGIGGSGVVASTCGRYVIPNHQFTRVDNMAVFNGTKYFNLAKQEFTFHIPIKNLDATALDKTFNVNQSYGSGTYSAAVELKLVHTPQ